MITIQAHTIFGEVTNKFDTIKEAMGWIEVNLANKVPFSSWSNEVDISTLPEDDEFFISTLPEDDEILVRKIFAYRQKFSV